MLNSSLQFPDSFLATAYESYSQKLSENHNEALKRLIDRIQVGVFEGVEVECGKSCSFSISPFSLDTKKRQK